MLDGKAALERQLDPALDAVELLRREKERIEVELEQDYETLRNLEVGARREARQKRELLKKAHALAPEKLRVKTEEADVVFKCDPDQAVGPVFAVCHRKRSRRVQRPNLMSLVLIELASLSMIPNSKQRPCNWEAIWTAWRRT